MKVDRICLIDPKITSLRIVITMSSNLMAGIEIKLLKSDKTTYKTIKTTITPNTKLTKDITIEPAQLHKGFLVWNVVLCSTDIKTETGTFELTLQQNLNTLRPTVPTLRNLTKIPPCKINRTTEFTDSLMFMIKSS